MRTTDFYSIFVKSSLKNNFSGVYSSDTLPKTLKVNQFIICNTDKSQNTGLHWYILFRNNLQTLECFDSLGIDDVKKQFLTDNFHLKKVRTIQFNKTRVQSLNSNTCGQFCVYFIYHRLHNLDLTFDEFINDFFDIEASKNEIRVSNFLSDLT